MSDKIFVGGIKTVPMQGPNGEWRKTTISFNSEDLQKLNDHKNDKGWVNIIVQKSKKNGKNYLEIDSYVPTSQQQDESPF